MSVDKSLELIAYVPVLHRAYLELFDSHPTATLNILSEEILERFDYLRKDINALDPNQAVELLAGYYESRIVRLIGHTSLLALSNREDADIVMPDDDISRALLSEYKFLPDNVELSTLFLRWHRDNVQELSALDDVSSIEAAEINPEIMKLLSQESSKASNMWRHVGAVVFDSEENIMDSAHNEAKPTPYTQTIEGDPRNSLKRGVGIEFSNDHHAEARIIARSARLGRALAGKSLAVTDFPCPPCAKDIAEAGISKLYFIGGYAALDGRSVLESFGVELIRITGADSDGNKEKLLDYKSSNSSQESSGS